MRRPERCECGHGEAMHDISRDGTRTACSVHDGTPVHQCPCTIYLPADDTPVETE